MNIINKKRKGKSIKITADFSTGTLKQGEHGVRCSGH
jgi:hypothetical protein